MNLSFRVTGLISLLLLLLFSGCERGERVTFSPEDMDPNYSRGKQLQRQGRNQEALLAFLKVIATRGDNAPESHLEAALIYEGHIKDPIAAIYHYRKFLELQGNSRQAEQVRPRIDAAKREFARTLPANPLDDASVKLGYMEQLDRLQRENDQLKAEIVALRAGLGAGGSQSLSGTSGASTPSAPRTTIDFSTPPPSVGQLPRPIPIETAATPDTRPTLGVSGGAQESTTRTIIDTGARQTTATPGIEVAPQRQVQPTGRSQPNAATAAKSSQQQQQASGKRHVVQPGDTLYSLSQRYYGTRTRWREILQANRDQLKGENDRLRLGMELRIP